MSSEGKKPESDVEEGRNNVADLDNDAPSEDDGAAAASSLSREALDEVRQMPSESARQQDRHRPPPIRVEFASEASTRTGRRSLDIRPESFELPQRPAPRRSPSSPLSAATTPLSPNSPTPPVIHSPRTRNRGYSLRRQLFFRNATDQGDGTASGTLPSAKPPSPKASAQDLKSSTDNGETKDGTGITLDASAVPVISTQTKQDISTGVGCKERLQRMYIFELLRSLKKYISKMNEIPPSKDGRKIPLDASRTQPLVDERRNGPFIDNTIRSSRYTIWNFLPRQLIAQFSKLANFYFLCVSILQMIPQFSTTGTYTTIVPLLFFITLSISKEGYDDYRRYKLDKAENNREVEIFRRRKRDTTISTDLRQENSLESVGDADWVAVKWKDVAVGDIVRLERDGWVPADLLLLHSDGEAGIAYVETAALDGETNLKSKQALPDVAKCCSSPKGLASVLADISVEDPNPDLYNFEGKITIDGKTMPLTNSQIIYRGSIIRNTPTMYGLVIFSGEETKIRMNANKNPRTKAPQLQAIVNKIVIFTVFFVLFLTAFNTVAYKIWKTKREAKSWYLTGSSVPMHQIFASFLIMFNTLIPLSLYVSLEIVKVLQMAFLNDIDMYHEESDTPFEARTSTINEDCGQVSYIFSDKTGTLTDNSMVFRKLSVAGVAWLHDLDIQRAARDGQRPLIRHKRRKQKKPKKEKQPGLPRKSMGDYFEPQQKVSKKREMLEHRLSMSLAPRESFSSQKWKSTAIPSKDQPDLTTVDLIRYIQDHPHTFFSRKARFMLLSMAICHTCLPEVDENGEMTYQAASPDELALVKAAMELGYIVIERQVDKITIKTFPNGPEAPPLTEVYTILDVIEFSSKRKRMSIIVRMPNGKVCIFSKGADSTMIELLKQRELAQQKALEVERKATKRKSLEAQEVIRRNSMQRTSMGRTPRSSLNINRLQTFREAEEFDSWLKERERADSVDFSSMDDESIYSRPSGQFGGRHSLAFGESKSPLERDTTDEFVDESLVLDDGRVYERCFAHVNDFATEGLRTLLYAYRMIDDNEYAEWKKIYHEATTSLTDRKRLTEEAADLIERDFELCGATAIEDKLQDGVPEAIDKLRRANIKLWMLTGDKRETAINIGHSCRLIKDYSTITILDKDADEDLGKKMSAATFEISTGRVAHSVVVVDGGTLAFIDADATLKSLFFDLTVLTDSVVCCRASPSQKASLVKSIRTKVEGSITLAIGDGANDIAMIQEAHIGVGITGKEGLQAARSSDYSFAQFRFLLKFLLVHGHWNYDRTCKYTVGTFWKEVVFYLTQCIFQRYNGYTGTSLYEPWSLAMFNTLFTSLPVIFLGVFEKDLAASTLLAVPELYSRGQRKEGFNFKVYVGWMFLGAVQAVVIFFVTYALYEPRLLIDNGVFALGVLCYSASVILISIKLQLIEMHNKSVIAATSFVLSIGGWFLWNIILASTYKDNTIYNVKDGILERFGRQLSWWLILLFVVIVAALIDVSFIAIRTAFYPSDVETFQEIEQSLDFRKRLEEAAALELQQGWDRGKKKTSEELAREEKEREVQELLDRPRIMEPRPGRSTEPRDLEEGRASLSTGVGANGLLTPTRPSMTGRRRSLVAGVNAPETMREDEEEDIEVVVAKRFGSIKRR